MKTTYRANDILGTEFDDPVECQIYEKVWQFVNSQQEASEWQCLFTSGYEEFTLKELVFVGSIL